VRGAGFHPAADFQSAAAAIAAFMASAFPFTSTSGRPSTGSKTRATATGYFEARKNRHMPGRCCRAERAILSPSDGIRVILAMRFEFDGEKSRDVKRKHGVSLREALEVFYQAYIVDQKSDDPEQFRAIGWCRGRLCSVIFEIRHDSEGEYFHLVTAWKATKEEEQSYAENV
jgi:uncharacterized DUF497 family protein